MLVSYNAETWPFLSTLPYSDFLIVSIRRKAVEPFAFSDGTTMQKGDWVCVPMAAMMHDPQRYRDPESFDGYRFLNANAHLRQGFATDDVPEKSPLKFTDVDLDWPIWGHGQMSW